jgi:hypothetical protein
MMLSETEKKMVEKLRKREAFLRRWRWPMVVFHGVLIIANIWLFVMVANFPDEPQGAKTIVLHLLTPVFFFIAFSAGWLGYLIANWNGNAKTVLLLKLIEEARKDGE